MKKLYLLSWLIFACTVVFATEPTVPASNINLNNVQGNSISFYVTGGDGAARIAIVKLGSPVTSLPQNGNSYYANNTFTEGQELAPGEFVVYSGSSSYITINGLVAETDYYVSIFEFNGSGASSEYLTSSYLTDTITTLFAPDVQPSALNISEVDGNLMNVNWNRGTGDGTIVLCKEGAPVNANPVELISYRANSNMHYRGINEASIIGDGNFVLYKGGDTTFTANNLYPDTDYHFAAFSYNGSSGPVYLTTNPARGNAATLSNPTIASTDLHTYGFVEGDRLQLQWTKGNGTRRIVVAREGAPVDAFPQNGINYTESSYFDQADSIAPGHKVIYDGGGTIAYAYNLKPATTYYFAAFEYSGSGDRIGYLTSEYPTHSVSTQAIPSINVSDIDTIEVTAYNAQLNFTPGDGMGRILVMKEGSPVDYVPTEFVRISSWSASFGTYGHVGNGNYVVYKGNGSSASVGLSPNKTYYVTAFEFNGTNYPVYNTANVDTFSFTTKLPPPPSQPSRNLWFSSVEGNSLSLQWNNGDGDRRVVIARKDSAITARPVKGVQYNANSAFNLAPELAPGHKIVYDGTSYHTKVDSLEIGTTYYFEVIEYNGSGDISNYLLSETLTGARSTVGSPTISSTNIHFKLITLDKLRIYWTRGSGERRLILARENAPVDGVPEDLSTYYSRTYFGGGAKIGESSAIFSGNFYGTDGNDADTVYTEITNINPGNTYHFSIFEYNGNQAPVYKKDDPEIGSFTVTFEPPSPATGFYVSSRDGNQLGMQWVQGGGDRRVIVAREGQPVDVVPQDGVDYASNEDFKMAPEIAPGQKVIYDGASYFGYARGLKPNTQYYFKIFEYGGTGSDIDYLTSAYDSTNGWTYGAPTIQATNLVVSGITPESGNVSWTNGDGQRRMAVVKKGGAVSVDPNDTTNYSWNNWFAGPSAYHLGDGNYVSYKGTANNFQLNHLLGGTTYHLAVYEYNGNVGPVLLRPPVTGKFTTLGPPQENAQVLDATLITKNSFQINFIPGSGQKRIIVMREGSPVDSDPVDDVNYVENTYLGAGDSIGSDNFVVYDGEDDNIIITGLTANRTYYFSIFEYNAFNGGTIVNYLIPTTALGMVTTLPDNIPPVLDSIENKSINEFEELVFNVTARDDDFPPQQLTYSLDSASLSLGMAIDPNTGVYSWIPGELNGGIDYPVTIIVTDDGNNPDTLSDSVFFTVSVMETNSAPTLDLVDDQYIDYDSTLTLIFTSNDTDIPFQGLSYSLNQPALDAGMILNSSTGEFNFTPVAAQSGLIYNVALTVTDDGSNPSELSDTVYFKIAVLEDTIAPVIGSVTNLVADNDPGQCGAIVEITSPTVVDNRDEITAVGTRNDGLALNSEFPVGETLIFWTAEDNSGNKADTVTQKVTVSDTTKPEFINLPADLSVSNDSSLCSAFVSWIVPSASDNCTLDTLFSNFQSGSVFLVGESTVIYTAKDIHGNLSIDSFKVTVHDNEFPVPDRPELSPLTADCRIADWIAPTATDNCGGQITGVPDLALPIDYDTTVTWTFTDADGNRSYQTQEIQISLGVNTWYADADGDGYGAIGTDSLSCEAPVGYVPNALDCDDFDPALNPEDGDGDGFSSCDGDCDDTNPAIFPGNPELCDGIDNNCDGQVDEGLLNIYYSDADGDGFGNAAIDTLSCSAPEGFVDNDLDCDDLNATVFPGASELCDGLDNDCDGETDEEVGSVWYADVDGDGFGDMNMDSVSCGQPVGYVVNGDDNCPDIFNPDQLDTDENGIGDICDETSGDCADSISILSLLTPIDPNPVNTLIEANAVISDASFAEAYWNWGDGSSTTHSTLSEVFSASHVYSEAGVYRIELIVSDTCGNKDTALSEYIPVYDPSGGFVTGGGWIWSPAGAYSVDPALTGKASFGFVAKYKKGSNIPEGHTEFHFRAGNLNFNSTSYDAMRLIISGAKAQFKGVGTINGSGNYGFLVSAVDGELAGGSEWDKFRIKIWDLDNDGAIVYDNNVDEYDDNAEPATTISGGSIIIHKTKGKKSAEIATAVHTSDQVFDLKVWPNPFVRELNFKFSSPGEVQGKLELFDVNGAKVVTLLNRTLRTDEMVDIQYVPVNMISGFYMYRLQLDDEIFTDLIIYKKN